LIHHITSAPQQSGGDAKPPVLIVMHGYGADENDLMPVARSVDPRFLIISLQGPIVLDWGGYAWYHLVQTAGGIHPDDHSRHDSERLIVGSLRGIIDDASGDPTRVTLLGFSQGAAMAFALMTSHKLHDYGITIKGVIAMSGYIPRDILDEIQIRDFAAVPFFLSHGDHDDLIPPIAMQEAERLLAARNAPIESHRYPIGHGISDETLSDLKAWVATNKLAE
jgi:phospholipase/carboxylesterase